MKNEFGRNTWGEKGAGFTPDNYQTSGQWPKVNHRVLVTFWAAAGITVDFQFLSLLIPQIIPTAKMIAKMRGTPTATNSNAI